MGFLVTVAVLVVAPPSGGAAARLDEARAAVVAAETARGVGEVLDDPRGLVAAGWTAERNLGFFARGAQLVSDGRRALGRVELEKAEALLAEAGDLYRAAAVWPGATAEWAEAAKWRGVALFELKRREEATRAWALAKALLPETQLTEAMVRPEVAHAFAATARGTAPAIEERARGGLGELGVPVVEVAIAVDAGVLTYAAARREEGCATATIVGTRAAQVVRRVHDELCRAGARVAVEEAAAIAHPRPAPAMVARAGARGGGAHGPAARGEATWRKPWLWVGVVGAVGVGVALGVALWPREPTYAAALDFHQFALGGR